MEQDKKMKGRSKTQTSRRGIAGVDWLVVAGVLAILVGATCPTLSSATHSRTSASRSRATSIALATPQTTLSTINR